MNIFPQQSKRYVSLITLFMKCWGLG